MIPSRALCLTLLILCQSFQRSPAIDVTTLSGKVYLDVHDIQLRGNQLTFTTDSDIVRIPLSDVPPALKARYQPKSAPAAAEIIRPQMMQATPAPSIVPPPAGGSPHDLVVHTGNRYLAQLAADLQSARSSGPIAYTAADAFSAAELDAARKDALINGRPVAFFIVHDALLTTPCLARESSAKGAFAQFFQVFKRNATPVFIFPDRDLAKLPGVLTIALGKPAAVPVPRVIFTNSEITETLHDLLLPSEKQTIAQREALIYPTVGMIKRWYVKIANSVP